MNLRLSNFYSINFLCEAYPNGPKLAYFKAEKPAKTPFNAHLPVPLQGAMEYSLIASGNAVANVNGVKKPVQSGDLLFLQAGSAPFEETTDDFSFFTLGILDIDFSFDETSVFATDTIFPDCLFYCQTIEKELKIQAGGYKKMLRSLFSCLHVLIKRHAAVLPEKTREKKPVKANANAALPAKKFIDTHYAKELDLKFLSGICGVTQQHLIKQFKLLTGTSPHQYLNRARVLAAVNLLLSKSAKSINVKDVSEKVGFQDPHSFLYTFKKLLGKTPLEFRKTYLTNPVTGLTYAKIAVSKKTETEKETTQNLQDDVIENEL